MWILQSQQDNLKWVLAETFGQKPEPRYQHAMTHYAKQNALIVSGGRNDKLSAIYGDIYFLALDSLTWLRVETVKGQGSLDLADHMLLPLNETEFIVLGGIDPTYKLANKISILAFTEERLWAYSHNSRTESPPKRS